MRDWLGPSGRFMSESTLPKVLVIDDSELIHRILRVRLAGERFRIFSASTAADGLAMARQLRPEVVLLDIDLDDMDGFDVLQRLKSDPETESISVIFISATAETAHKVRGLDLGAVDFIGKPFDHSELKARVRSAIRVQQLIRILKEKAQIDGLSGLSNRDYLERRLGEEVAEAARYSRKLTLIMCDIDGFKGINDSYGHPFGDQVIERYASILSSGRASDIACRYGGDEFAVILPQTSAEEAMEVAERYRQQIEQARFTEHPNFSVSASLGIADLSAIAGVPTADALVHAADAALYEAKQQGRNRVSVAAAPPAVPG